MPSLSRRTFVQQLSQGVGAAVALPTPGASLPTAAAPARKLNVALCGLGRYATILAGSLAASQHCRLAGLVTGTPSKAAQWQRDYQLPARNCYSYETFDQLRHNPDIDLVYITLPNGLHKEYTLRAAAAGKHVIVEKPMALTEQDCREMMVACQRAGIQLAVGYRLHYDPYHQQLMRLGQQKIFGQVRLIEASLGYRLAGIPPMDWHLSKALAGGGPLMNLGVYCVQSARYTLGEEPVAVTAQLGPVTMPELFKEVEENISWQLTFPSGAVCTSSSTSNCSIDRYYAAANDGYFELAPALSYGPFSGRTSRGVLQFASVNQQAAQLDDVALHILANQPVPAHIAGEEGRKDLRVLEAIYHAAYSGQKVHLA